MQYSSYGRRGVITHLVGEGAKEGISEIKTWGKLKRYVDKKLIPKGFTYF